MNGSPTDSCVCIPARNEAERIPIVLGALSEQSVSKPVKVVLSINNSNDCSREVAERCRSEMKDRIDIIIDEAHFTPDLAHAGSARRRVMDLGVDLVGAKGIIITTDADARPPVSWVEDNVLGLSAGLDVVGGRIVLDENEPISQAVLARQAAQERYWHQVRAIEDAIDPVAWDQPPRHGDHTGGSLAMTVACYLRAGRVPTIASGEDRALVFNAVRAGGKLAHPNRIWTRVSPRIAGRATSGMADHMAMMQKAAEGCQPVWLPAFAHWRERALWRRALRERGGSSLVAEREPELPDMPQDMQLDVDGLSYPPARDA